ncbi:glutamic acid-rich protein isoform X3 [Bicyclus anynana]|uniref:Glutamic acid-rich protein isoform X3 n=1 Tax=Bicyclus anynana TaxID=110368 RepID=A0A6J1N9B4_BICAN|nr:glutamic acid-rich protein isoform X3 [Bicyclus anynana]
MSQIVTRKGPIGEEKEKDKRQTNSPVKEMKKKIAANAEKEKQAAEKNTDKSAQNEKDKKVEKASEKTDKTAEKSDKKDKLDKSIDKKDKSEKSVDKKEKLDKSLDKKDKAEKSGDSKVAEKKENVVEKEKSTDKKEVEDKKEDKSQDKEKDAKVETEDKSKKPETKVKENGAKVNGEQNGDTVKATRTPETPRPASEKLADRDYVPDESKLLKLKDDVPASDRKLRSADSPKPHDKKEKSETGAPESTDKVAIPVVILEECSEVENKMEDTESNAEEKTEREIEVVLEVENEDEGRVKADTNYSKSRVKVSPYRRSARLADNTNTSLLANYTGNNTTMEMDITETSSFLAAEAESPYLSGLRSIRGRRSYKPLREMALRSIGADRSTRSTPGASVAEQPSRPTGTVVGRKRKPSRDDAPPADEERGKRARLLERLAKPFRMASTPLPARRAAEIVGINTDLPLSAPVASTETFDPEAIKAPGVIPVEPPTPVNPHTERDSKRCVVM